jgi:hypothetical protein
MPHLLISAFVIAPGVVTPMARGRPAGDEPPSGASRSRIAGDARAVALAPVAGIASVRAGTGLGGHHDWQAWPAVIAGATAVVLMTVYVNSRLAAGLVISLTVRLATLAAGARTLPRT